MLLSRLLYVTEGKYGNQLEKIRKFRVVLSSGSHETGSTGKKSDYIWFSQARTPHTFIFLVQGLRVCVEMGTKSEKVCMCVCVCVCDAFLFVSISPYISKVRSHFWLKFGMVPSIYGALMLLNFCRSWGRGLGARTKLLGVSNWRKLLGSTVLGIYLKLS